MPESDPPRRIVPVIMSGGSGTRLWPLSTDAAPKQFKALVSELTMIQETVLRVQGSDGLALQAPIVICNAQHEALVQTQFAEISAQPHLIVLEPAGRNTAVVAAMAAQLVQAADPEALVLLLPADHVIRDPEGFRAAVLSAADTARSRIVTFGIVPDGPETGYGYIQKGEEIASGIFAILAFKEKPDLGLAESYIARRGYYWNAGIFLYAPGVMIDEMRRLRPDIASAAEAAISASTQRGGVLPLDAQAFAACPSESIDHAVMEHTARAAVAPCSVGWADVGSWSELWRLGPHDSDGNLRRGRTMALDSSGCLVWSQSRLVTILGVEDLVVVETDEAIIVVPRARAQEVKRLAAEAAASRSADKGGARS